MNTKIKLALSAIAALGVSAAASIPASAADVVYEEPPAIAPIAPITHAPVSTWAGPYVGAHLGYGFAGRVTEPGNRITTNGFMGGGFGGFNMQDGQFVYGIEGDVNYSNFRGSNAGVNARTSIDGSLRARLGYAVTDDVLLYGTAGVAAERLRVRDNVVGDNDTNAMYGYTVGAGADLRLTDQVFARGEYRFTDYGRRNFDIGGVNRRIDSHNHRVTVGLGVKF